MIDLSVVVVTFTEHPDVLRRCFESLAASQGLTIEVVVVDNANRPATAALLKQVLSTASYLPNRENRGFAAAVNVGMRAAKGTYILLLNPDTEFQPQVLASMVDHLRHDSEVGIASAVIRYPDGSLQESIRRFPTLWNQVLILFKIPHLWPHVSSLDRYMMRDVDPLQTQDVESIMGAFMFITRPLIERIGLFDERYFIWFEEVDYCKQAHDAQFKIRHYADVSIVHHKGHTFNQLATLRKQKWIRQSLRKYMRKHDGFLSWVVLWILTPVFIVLAYLAAFIKRG
jgi:GT2 family glycosyltransferase